MTNEMTEQELIEYEIKLFGKSTSIKKPRREETASGQKEIFEGLYLLDSEVVDKNVLSGSSAEQRLIAVTT